MPPQPDVIKVAKGGLKTRFETLVPGELKSVLDYEPLKAKGLPQLTIMFEGFRRRGLESPEVQGEIIDPLGHRLWVLTFIVRLWVALRGDEKAAQYEMDDLAPKVVRALEAEPSLGGVATDSAIATGELGIVRPKQGNPLLMLTCATAVEISEPTT